MLLINMNYERNKKKILFVGAFPKSQNGEIYGGQLTVCKLLTKSELINKYNLLFLDSTTIKIPPPNFLIRAIFAFFRLLKFTFKVKVYNPKVIIIFFAGFSSTLEKSIMLIIGKLFNKKIMIFPRAGALISNYNKNIIFKFYVKQTLSLADKFLCQGKNFQDFAISQLNFKKKDCPIIPNWTATETFLELGLHKKISCEKETTNLVFIGWVEEFKGIYEIIEASLKLKNKRKKFHIYICGDGKGMKNLKKLIKKYGLEKFVTLLGWIDGRDKINILKNSDIFILPSWNEGLPNSMIEAMSSGLACIVSDVGALSYYIKHEENGLLIKPKCPDELASSIMKLIDDKILLKKISRNSFNFAMKNFTIKKAEEIFEREIESLS